MRFTTADRELPTIPSIEGQLAASLPKSIREEAISVIRRIAELVSSKRRWHREMAEALVDLKKILGPIRRWSLAKSVIGAALGKDERTVQRLAIPPDKKKSAREEARRNANPTSGQGLSDIPESSASSATAVCLRIVDERPGLRFTPRANVHFPSGGDCVRKARALEIVAQMKALNISISDLDALT